MTSNTTNIAFKEWAVICKLLEEGRQILILRKGGIVEKGGYFQPEHSEFFLFPTLAHEQVKGLKQEASQILHEIEKTNGDAKTIDISLFVKITETLWITDEEKLPEISPFHFWADENIRSRFHYGQEKGIFAMIARVFRLPTPHAVPVIDRYAGCKSWVDMEEALPTSTSQPVLPDADFEQKRRELIQILEPSLAR